MGNKMNSRISDKPYVFANSSLHRDAKLYTLKILKNLQEKYPEFLCYIVPNNNMWTIEVHDLINNKFIGYGAPIVVE